MASSLLVSFQLDVPEFRIQEIFEEHDFFEYVEPPADTRRDWTPHYRDLQGVITRYLVEVPYGQVKKYLDIFANLSEVRNVQAIEEFDKPKRTYKRNMDDTTSKNGKKFPKRK